MDRPTGRPGHSQPQARREAGVGYLIVAGIAANVGGWLMWIHPSKTLYIAGLVLYSLAVVLFKEWVKDP